MLSSVFQPSWRAASSVDKRFQVFWASYTVTDANYTVIPEIRSRYTYAEPYDVGLPLNSYVFCAYSLRPPFAWPSASFRIRFGIPRRRYIFNVAYYPVLIFVPFLRLRLMTGLGNGVSFSRKGIASTCGCCPFDRKDRIFYSERQGSRHPGAVIAENDESF